MKMFLFTAEESRPLPHSAMVTARASRADVARLHNWLVTLGIFPSHHKTCQAAERLLLLLYIV